MSTSPQSAPRRVPDTPSTPSAAARFGGLDGLRALAVGLVLVYHLFPDALPGGFLGVDIFFVISGFLITSLLLRERTRTGRIDLSAFWRRRARRLLPALVLVLLVSTTLAKLAALRSGTADLLVNIGAQLFGALFFVSNWVFIALGGDYFTRDTPELLRNTWSLSIEEQFYVALPILLIFTLRAHSRFSRSLLFIALSVGSAILMAVAAAQGELPTRVYFGSDTHIFGLFAGVSLAVLLHPGTHPSRAPHTLRPVAQLGLITLAGAGFAVLGWLTFTLPEGSPQSFAWGFQLASAAALLIVWAVTRPGAWLGAALDTAPLRWIGERSYGIYLWHWPLLLTVPPLLGLEAIGAGTPASGAAGKNAAYSTFPLAELIVLALSIACAALSFRYVEQPIRRLGMRGTLRKVTRLARRPLGATSARVPAAIVTLVLAITLPITIASVATAPARSTAADAIARGQTALADQHRAELTRAATEQGIPGVIDGLDGRIGVPAGAPIAREPSAPAQPDIATGDQIFALGDSVMLASLPELQTAFPGIEVDAAVSRGLGAGLEIARVRAEHGHLRPVLVVGLGTNGPIERSDLSELKRIADTRPIVLVNAHADRWWIPEVNQTLAAFANARRGVVLADWDGAVAPVPDALAGDGIHPNPSGGDIYAAVIRDALAALETPAERITTSK